MLAIAMEVAARNQLTDEESVAVLRRALRIDADAGRTLLDELAPVGAHSYAGRL